MPETEQALVSNGSPVRDSAAGKGKSEAVNYGTLHLLNTIPDKKSRKQSIHIFLVILQLGAIKNEQQHLKDITKNE